MTLLKDHISIARRYQRSINIAEDLGTERALEGYVFPDSAASTLRDFAAQVGRTGQGAFTWTGAYGSGKSSLLVALAALLDPNRAGRIKTASRLSIPWAREFWSDLDVENVKTRVIGLVCEDAPLEVTLGRRLKLEGLIGKTVKLEGPAIVRALKKVMRDDADRMRIIIAADELGRALSHTASHPESLSFFQDLAELANRSDGGLIFIGILHQRFVDYAKTASTAARENWMKVQGRYSDLAIDVQAHEQLALIGQAITSDMESPDDFSSLCNTVARMMQLSHKDADGIASAFVESWPLHPIVTALLGPMSRRASGQNYRSIFTFLNSAEPFGFQAYLQRSKVDDLFDPMDLWDYIDHNYRGAILSSDYSKNWALALDTLSRAEALGFSSLELQLVKAVTLLDWLKAQSGLPGGRKALGLMTAFKDPPAVDVALSNLASHSLLTFREYNNSWKLFEGSDFNVDDAIKTVVQEGLTDTLAAASRILDLPPALAKRHYHRTGTLRWMSLELVSSSSLSSLKLKREAGSGHFATLLLGLMKDVDACDTATALSQLSEQSGRDVLFAPLRLSKRTQALLHDISALQQLPGRFPELNGDRVARREVRERLSDLCRLAETDIRLAMQGLSFSDSEGNQHEATHLSLSQIADQRAAVRFPQSPQVNSEILNREKPSATANTALKKLLYALDQDTGRPDAGINLFPAERGLLDALLVRPGLYLETDGRHGLVNGANIPQEWKPIWEAALQHLESADGAVSATDLYAIWSSPPFGIARGVLPLVFYIFVRSEWSRLAFYRQGLFRASLTDVDIDYLLKSPDLCQLRWLELSGRTRALLGAFGDIAVMSSDERLGEATPLNISRALVSIFDALPNYAKRTTRLSTQGRRLRTVFQKANDPARLLFEELPAVVSTDGDADVAIIAKDIRLALDELQKIFPNMVQALWTEMLTELGVPNGSDAAVSELIERAEKLTGLSDRNTIEAFVSRIARYDGSLSARIGVLGLFAGKPTEQWMDSDVKRAQLRLGEFVREFRMLEQYGTVDRKAERQTIAVIVRGDEDAIAKTVRFSPLRSSQASVEALAKDVLEAVLSDTSTDDDVKLAAIIRASEILAQQQETKKAKTA